TRDNLNTIIYLVSSFFISTRIDFHRSALLGCKKVCQKIAAAVYGTADISAWIVGYNNVETFIHNIRLFRKLSDKVNIIIHKHTQEHVILRTAQLGESINIRANINAL